MRFGAGLVARWSLGLVRRRPWILAGQAVSVALAVGFMVTLGSFADASRSSLTVRAAHQVAVDWQVQVTPQGSAPAVAEVLRSTRGVRAAFPVRYHRVAGLTATTGSVTRATGAAVVVSLPPGYEAAVPGQVRHLLGAHHGVLLLQQTGANLGAVVGTRFSIPRDAGPPVTLTADGIVDMPQADSFFQVVGAPMGGGAVAPPDNVVLVPPRTFDALALGPGVVTQFHTLLDHGALPNDPAAASDAVTQMANHVAVQVAGGALVGDNLAASLSTAREDAIYAQLLFLLIGVPGLAVAGIVGALLVALRADSRRREVGLLLLRGAGRSMVAAMTLGEVAIVASAGDVAGVCLGVLCTHAVLQVGTPVSVPWVLAASCLGVALAVLTQLVPALRATSRFTLESVASAASRVPSTRQPWPLRFGLDGVFLALAAIVAALNARNGYHVVVVPEGVPVASVNYGALLAPAFAWPGLVLLAWRLTAAAARRRSGRWAPARSRHAPELVAATVRRRRQVIARGAAGLTAAIGLGASTAIFVATYDQQSHLDVALTVGADVAAKAAPGVTATPREVALASSAPGVTGVQSMLHEFAYVGPDLQDIFGVDPARIASVVSLQDSFVPGSTIAATMHALGATPDGVLLSGETIRDYQLRPGDLIRLRLQSRPNGPFRTVPFHVVGQITEFPTAPRDSFIVADAHYLQRVTHWPGATTLLLSSSDPTRTASSLHRSFGAGWAVQDVVSARNSVITASGLAATDLGALARLDLGFALAFSLACAALAIGLGISERRRAFVVLTALGASASQRARFSDAEGVLLMVSGIVCGAGVGLAIGYLLVAVLNGIFDPPPDGLVVPAALLSLLGLAVVVLGSTVLKVTGWLASRFTADRLRDL